MHAPTVPVHEELGRERKVRALLIEIDRIRINTGATDREMLAEIERYTAPRWGTLASIARVGDPSQDTRGLVIETLKRRLRPVGI